MAKRDSTTSTRLLSGGVASVFAVMVSCFFDNQFFGVDLATFFLWTLWTCHLKSDCTGSCQADNRHRGQRDASSP